MCHPFQVAAVLVAPLTWRAPTFVLAVARISRLGVLVSRAELRRRMRRRSFAIGAARLCRVFLWALCFVLVQAPLTTNLPCAVGKGGKRALHSTLACGTQRAPATSELQKLIGSEGCLLQYE